MISDRRYILKSNGKLWCIYYDSISGICFSSYSNTHWSNPDVIFKDGVENFSVSLTMDDQMYLFVQNLNGDVVLFYFNGSNWKHKSLQQNKSKKIYNMNFHADVAENGLTMVYNLPDDFSNSHFLITTFTDNAGLWHTPNTIDLFIPLNGEPFVIRKISNNHYVLFYQTRKHENSLVYREMLTTTSKFSAPKVIHSSTFYFMDQSFLTTSDAIHALYVIKGLFSYQLIYRKKDSSDFSPPVMIFESQKIDNAMIFILENRIWVTFESIGGVYYSISSNNGSSFSRATKYRGTLNSSLSKSIFLTNDKQVSDSICLSYVYTSKDNPLDIMLIPDLFPDFFPKNVAIPKKISKKTTAPNTSHSYTDSAQDQLDLLKNRLNMANTELGEKERQLVELSEILKQRTEEVNQLRSGWHKRNQKFIENNTNDDSVPSINSVSPPDSVVEQILEQNP